ncbi:MAG: hypothetical protein KGV43_02595 [Arcobacter sp.]|nr:hypothetical protein [Arcobacter sp.]
MKIFSLVFVVLFFLSCSYKNDILNSSLQRTHIKLSKKEKEELEKVYKQNYDFWNKHPRQADMFIENNFTKEAIDLRSTFIGKNIQEVKKTLSYEKIDIKKKKTHTLYNFVQGMSEFSFIVEDKIIQNVYIYDLI